MPHMIKRVASFKAKEKVKAKLISIYLFYSLRIRRIAGFGTVAPAVRADSSLYRETKQSVADLERSLGNENKVRI